MFGAAMKHYEDSPFTDEDTLGLWLMQEEPKEIIDRVTKELDNMGYCIKRV
jgi:hypothetical protein